MIVYFEKYNKKLFGINYHLEIRTQILFFKSLIYKCILYIFISLIPKEAICLCCAFGKTFHLNVAHLACNDLVCFK